MMDGQIRTLQKKRTANFREDETRLLIQLWGSPTVQNRLFLTHRKAPVMRMLASNMQQRGFVRTPDEIKTRIRNLKCLYHRIKRTVSNGTGLGTVDPDWPHYRAMDAILSKEYPRKDDGHQQGRTDDDQDEEEVGSPPPMIEPDTSMVIGDVTGVYLDGPKCEEIKQEVDLDLDDNDSWATNDSMNSEYEDELSPTPPPPLRPAPRITIATNLLNPPASRDKPATLSASTAAALTAALTNNHTKLTAIKHQQQYHLPSIKPKTIAPMPQMAGTAISSGATLLPASFTLTTSGAGGHHFTQTVQNSHITQSNQVRRTGGLLTGGTTTSTSGQGGNTIPLPLLILNGLQPHQQQQQLAASNGTSGGNQSQDGMKSSNLNLVNTGGCSNKNDSHNAEVSNLLRSLLDVQRDNLAVQREKLEVEKQRLEYDRIVGTQLITLLPMMGNIINRLSYTHNNPNPNNSSTTTTTTANKQPQPQPAPVPMLIEESEDDDDEEEDREEIQEELRARSARKRTAEDDGKSSSTDVLKDSKILKSMLEEGIKKYMMVDHPGNKDSDNEDDSGIHNDDGSDCSDKSDLQK